MGAGTTGLVARQLGRDYLGCELNPDYAKMAEKRIRKSFPTGRPLSPEQQQLSGNKFRLFD